MTQQFSTTAVDASIAVPVTTASNASAGLQFINLFFTIIVKGIFLAHYGDNICHGFTLLGSLPFPFSLQLPLSLKTG